MNILLVDDEALARQRLRRLLAGLEPARAARIEEAADAAGARDMLRRHAFDLVLLDIQMPGGSGLELAAELAGAPGDAAATPAVVFVTAHEEHALQAFEHGAYDYLTKPVRAERLLQALLRVQQRRSGSAAPTRPGAKTPPATLAIVERGALLRVPLAEVLYFRSRDKYTVVRTPTRSYLSDESLGELEQRYGERFVRSHRSVLVALDAIASLQRVDAQDPHGPAEAAPAGEAEPAEWMLRLRGTPELLPVSRRQLPVLRALLRG